MFHPARTGRGAAGRAAVLPEGGTGMTGAGLAAILIPIAGTILLATWLALVFYAGGHPGRAVNPAAGRESPGPAALADRRQSGAILRVQPR
jgi:hypothetical protein